MIEHFSEEIIKSGEVSENEQTNREDPFSKTLLKPSIGKKNL